MRTGLTIALLISLGANMLLGGFIAGRLVGGPGPGGIAREAPPRAGPIFFRDLDALTPEQRETFRAAFRAHSDEIRAGFRDSRRLRQTLGEALAADPWDRARVEKALADLQAVEGAHEAAVAKAVIDAFETLPAEQRKALIEQGWRRHHADAPRRRHGPPAMGDTPPPPGDDEAPTVEP